MNQQEWLSSIAVALIFLSSPLVHASEIETEFSGYGRIVGGILDDSDKTYQEYDNSINFDRESLLGLQGHISFNDKLSVTALGVAYANNEKDSQLEWLYLSYRPIKSLDIKIGQLQTPFFSVSDSLDIGYSYPWVIAPKEVYSDSLPDRFLGAGVRYSHFSDAYSAHLETYYGQFKDDFSYGGNDSELKAENLSGLIGEIRVGNFNVRTSYHASRLSRESQRLTNFSQQLSTLGFNDSAESLDIDNNNGKFFQFSANYETLNHFLKTEWVHIKVDTDLIPRIKGYYLTYGRYFGDVTALITYGNRRDRTEPPANEIPTNVSPQLDALATTYRGILSLREAYNSESWTAGLRWDFHENMAIKGELKHISSRTSSNGIFIFEGPERDDRNANLLSVALEWVF